MSDFNIDGYFSKKMEFLNLFVHLDDIFYKVAVPGMSIDELIKRLDSHFAIYPPSAGQQRVLDQLKRIYEDNKINGDGSYGKITVHHHPYPRGKIFNTETDIVRANFFIDGDNVIFSARGTGDGRWIDNAQMMIEPSSQMQRATCDYFDEVMYSLGFVPKRIDLTGHSKGANDVLYEMMFSKYLTELRNNNKDVTITCFAMNAPGFSKATIDKFYEHCDENGLDPDEIRKNMFMVIGDNDYVNWFGRRIVPEENIYVLATPRSKDSGNITDFGNYHALEFMDIDGATFAVLYDEDGKTIDIVEVKPLYKDGEIQFELLGPLGKLGYELQKLQLKMEDEAIASGNWDHYEALSYSIMAFMERFMAKSFGAGDIKSATPEQLQLFFREVLPLILDIFNDNPELLKELVTEIFFSELDPEVAMRATNGLFDLMSRLPADKLAEVLIPFICYGESFNISALVDMIPDISKWIKDNPGLLKEIIFDVVIPTFFKDKLPSWAVNLIDKIPPWAINALEGFIADVLSSLPSNVLADLLASINEGSIDIGAAIALILSAVPALAISGSKHIIGLVIDGIEFGAKKIVETLSNVIAGGIGYIGEGIKSFNDFVLSLTDDALSALSNLSSDVRQFLSDVLNQAKQLAPSWPWLQNSISNIENLITNIDNTVKNVIDMGKSLIDSINRELNNVVDSVVSGAKSIVDAVSGFTNWVITQSASVLQTLNTVYHDVKAKVIKGLTELVWEFEKFTRRGISAVIGAAKAVGAFVNNIKNTVTETIASAVDVAVSAIKSTAKAVGSFIKDVKNIVTDAAKSAIEGVVSAVKGAAQVAGSFIKDIKNIVTDAAKSAIEGVVSTVKGTAQVVGSFIKDVKNIVADAAKSTFEGVISAVKGTTQVVGSLAKDVKNIVSDAAKSTFEGVVSAAKGTAKAVGTFVNDIKNTIVNSDGVASAIKGTANAIGSFANNIKNVVTDGAKSTIEGAVTVIKSTAKAVGSFVNGVKNVVTDAAKSAIEGAVTAIKSTAKAVGSFVNGVKNVVTDAAKSAIEGAVTATKSTAKAIGSFVNGVKNVATDAAKSAIDGAVIAIKSTAKAVSSFVNGVKNVITDAAKSAIEGAVTAIKSTTKAVGSFVNNVISIATDTAKSAIDIVSSTIKSASQAVGSFQAAKLFVTKVVNKITEGAKSVYEGVVSAVKSTAQAAKSFVANAINKITEGAKSVYEGVVSAAKSTVQAAKSFTTKVISKITEGAKSVYEGVVSAVKRTTQAAKTFVTNAINKITEGAKSVYEGIVSAVKSAAQAARVFIKDIIYKATDAAKSAYEGAVSAVKSASQAVRKFIGALAVLGLLIHDSSLAANVKAPSSIGIQSEGRINADVANTTSGRVSVNIKALRELKRTAEDLLNELLKPQHANVIRQARTHANNAINRHDQSYVRSDANNIFTVCNELETARSRVCADLRTEIYGLGRVIDGYLELESSFV